jgi:pyridoxamine 5'-phosphate oxidase
VSELPDDPFVTFGAWLRDATASEPNDPAAMTLATATPAGRPSARMVLLKSWDERGLVFYTNLGSRKSGEIRENAQAALLFHWKTQRRQIRIEGVVSAVDGVQADEYFASRPRHSQLGAWASDQSRPLASREVFLARLAATEARFAGADVPRPEFWAGWRVSAESFEFWQDIKYRLHDRQIFVREGQGWQRGMLYP